MTTRLLNKQSSIAQVMLIIGCILCFILNSNYFAMVLLIGLGAVQLITAGIVAHHLKKSNSPSPRYIKGLFVYCIAISILGALIFIIATQSDATIYYLFLLSGTCIISAIIFLFNTLVQGFAKNLTTHETQ
jgi:heme/copper-type cytochrome/quinol oxidase subunit 4